VITASLAEASHKRANAGATTPPAPVVVDAAAPVETGHAGDLTHLLPTDLPEPDGF